MQARPLLPPPPHPHAQRAHTRRAHQPRTRASTLASASAGGNVPGSLPPLTHCRPPSGKSLPQFRGLPEQQAAPRRMDRNQTLQVCIS
jgi:hypothetical protein